MTCGKLFVGFDEARELLESVNDPRVYAGMMLAYTTVITRRGMDPSVQPSHDFDMRFFLEVVKSMFEAEIPMRLIVEGRQNEMHWWDGELDV